MVTFCFLHTILDELVSTCLLDIIVEPGQIELIHAEADKV